MYNIKMKKYIVTGGEGFIGGKIAVKTGAISYDLKSGLDILDKNKLNKAVTNVEGIFHCAAKISVPESFQLPEEYYRNNVEGTACVIESAKKIKSKIIFSSSAAVYGDTPLRVNEDSILNPKSPYAENKSDGEILLGKSEYGNIALRYFNVYGPGQSAQYAGVITSFILKALKNEDLLIYGDGNQVRDFVFVDDVVRANLAAMAYDTSSFQIFNIGTGVETTINTLANKIIELAKSSSKIKYMPSRVGDIVYSQADVSKAKNLLGWEAQVSLDEGLLETIEYYKAS